MMKGPGGIKTAILCLCFLTSIGLWHPGDLTSFLQQDSRALAAEKKAEQGEEDKGTVLNISGRALGSVSADGVISNRYGKSVGSVDSGGAVYNVSKIVVGKVSDDGKVFNQTGTLLGFVDSKGNVLNRLEKKVGSIEGIDSIILMGGGARLLLLKPY